MLEILRSQYTRGYASELDVAAQQAQLAQATATLPPLLKQLAQQRDLLAVLAGGFPDKELEEKFELSSFQLPRDLPLSLPSKLVEHRPDVLHALENLHAASALIGVAHANRLPSFAITADAGSMALIFTHMFDRGGFWDATAGLTQPVFDGGTLRHRERAARAAYTQADKQYRSTVLTAFQNVADTLHAIKQDADGLKSASAATEAAGVTLELTKKQLDAGYANYLAVLTAEQVYQQAVLNLVEAQSNRYADTAALFQALGGGWWNRSDLPKQ
jgi:NodT family efflux transporter outer membrane factor (OMF) lipoprotein